MHNLRLLLQRLADAQIDFVVIGGYAGVLHGSSLVTNDLDICTVLTSETIAKLRQAFADLHPVHRMTHKKLSFLEVPAIGSPLHNLHLETDHGIMDVLSNVLGIGEYSRLRQNAVELPIFGRQCAVISLEDLIAAKEALGREKDLLAAKELRAIAAKRAQG
ncbi:MAG: nucleotidyltransferase [Opitutaceae bacterium]|nr:nucleotidyltransferase [Opitutaceae bacterium]